MSETLLQSIGGWLIVALLTVIATILYWIADKGYKKLCDIADRLGAVKDELHDRITEVHNELSYDIRDVDVRVARIEAKCEVTHTGVKHAA